MKYNQSIVVAYYREMGLPEPVFEHRFDNKRKWRFDLAWPDQMVALEVDGGIWVQGRHNRGAAMKAQWEKENAAQVMGWTILKCEPKDICTEAVVRLVRGACNAGAALVRSDALLADLVEAYEREVDPTEDWRDTALTKAEWSTATAEYRAAKAFLSANAAGQTPAAQEKPHE